MRLKVRLKCRKKKDVDSGNWTHVGSRPTFQIIKWQMPGRWESGARDLYFS
jgi:hypothetical protein